MMIDRQSRRSASPTGAAHHHSGEERIMTEQQIRDAYTMIDAAVRLADKLEGTRDYRGDSVTLQQLAEYIERTVVPIELRRQ
jgi:hypothetical protein